MTQPGACWCSKD